MLVIIDTVRQEGGISGDISLEDLQVSDIIYDDLKKQLVDKEFDQILNGKSRITTKGKRH